MTGEEIKTMAEEILGGDTLDVTFYYNVLNAMKNKVEDERPWMFLRALDSSQTATTGNNSTTSRALPTAWRNTYKLLVGDDTQYFQVPFDMQHQYRNHGRYFVVDVANSTYYLLGNVGKADTIYHYYVKTTDDITSTTSPVWPTRFHHILAYEVAGYVQVGQDADDIFARMAPENKAQANMLLDSMRMWDTRLQLQAQNNQLQVTDSTNTFDLGQL
jgi:hypothetical protein